MNCKNCGYEVAEGELFCSACGTRVSFSSKQEASGANFSGGFVQSIKKGIGSTEVINKVKSKVNSVDKAKRKKICIVSVTAIILIIAVSLFINVHTCERCGRIYMGKGYNFHGEFNDYQICRDCFMDYCE